MALIKTLAYLFPSLLYVADHTNHVTLLYHCPLTKCIIIINYYSYCWHWDHQTSPSALLSQSVAKFWINANQPMDPCRFFFIYSPFSPLDLFFFFFFLLVHFPVVALSFFLSSNSKGGFLTLGKEDFWWWEHLSRGTDYLQWLWSSIILRTS